MPDASPRDRWGAPARVLVVDDHAGVRRGVIRLIGTSDDFVVVGEAANGVEAVQLASRLAPDLVLMDVSMPMLDGVAATREIAGLARRPAIVLFTAWADRNRIAEAISAGASGHVLKDAPPAEFFRALRAALAAPRPTVLSGTHGNAPDDPVGTQDAEPQVGRVIAIGARTPARGWQGRVAAGAAALLVLGTAGVAAASDGNLPAPMQAAARFAGLPMPTTRLEEARHALARLDAALQSGDRTAIAAAAEQLQQQLGGLDVSDQARVGASGALRVAAERLRPAPTNGPTVSPPPNRGGPAAPGTTNPASTPTTEDHHAGGADDHGGGPGGNGSGGGRGSTSSGGDSTPASASGDSGRGGGSDGGSSSGGSPSPTAPAGSTDGGGGRGSGG